mgnify:CR=1 FL=1
MQHEEAKYLVDALQACEAIVDFTRNKSLDEYRKDFLLRSAVERQFEILGEAFSRLNTLDSEYREHCPEMGKIIGMRNRLIHGYDTVDDSIVWDAIQNHLPPLLKWLKSFSL